jgi:Right handed beta helix region
VSRYFCLLWFLLTATSGCWSQTVVRVTDLGARPDGSNAAATTAAFQQAFTNNPKGQIQVPPGSYLLDNSKGPLVVNNFSGELQFEGAAQLVFTTNTNGGMLFEGGTGAIITGLHATYASPPTTRASPNEEIKFSGTTGTILTNVTVENSPAAGILFYDSVNPSVTNATVLNSLADGLNFSNCQNARVVNLLTQNTGDDGLSFINYAQYPDLIGGLAQNVTVINSRARGIAVAGQSNITVSGFQIQNTSSSGVLVAQDAAHDTRIPANVLVANGAIYGAGTLAPVVGNQYGIEFNSQKNVTFENIRVVGSGNTGLSGTAPNGRVSVSNISVDSPRSGNGFLFYRTQNVQIANSSANNTSSYGFAFFQSKQVIANGLIAIHASVADPLRRAVWFEDVERVLASVINVVSDPREANSIGCHTDSGYQPTSGVVKLINSEISGVPAVLSIQNTCPSVNFIP